MSYTLDDLLREEARLSQVLLKKQGGGIVARIDNSADTAIDTASMGFSQTFTTLTNIRTEIIRPKRYSFKLSDFMSVDLNTSGMATNIQHFMATPLGGTLESRLVGDASNNSRMQRFDTGFDSFSIPTQTWGGKVEVGLIELERAFAVTEGKLALNLLLERTSSAREMWDIDLQQVSMVGLQDKKDFTGLLNSNEVDVNMSVMSKPIWDLTPTELSNLVGKMVKHYVNQTNYSEMPDTLVVPYEDWVQMGNMINADFPHGDSRVNYLKKAFSAITQKSDFKILPNAFANASRNKKYGLNKDRYVLYNNDPRTLKLFIGRDFTTTPFVPNGAGVIETMVFGVFSPVAMLRPQEVAYFDGTYNVN